MSLTVFWYRRDLRLDDNAGLFHALREKGSEGSPVQPIFIFDTEILDALRNPQDRRVVFLHRTLQSLKDEFQKLGADLWVFQGRPVEIFKELMAKHSLQAVYTNQDYEPSARARDEKIEKLCRSKKVEFKSFKDQVIFEKDEVLTDSQKPYTVYTPYKKKWLSSLSPFYFKSYPTTLYFHGLNRKNKATPLMSLNEIGFRDSGFDLYPEMKVRRDLLSAYAKERDFPALEATSKLGLHLRFGTLSVRELAREAQKHSAVWLSELVWREFFMQILYHFPRVEKQSFRTDYDQVEWRNSSSDFEKWCEGMTGYPLVDAGMRELRETGYMHNRARMVTASFLTKHLLMHWSRGEKHFASLLLDYDLAANNGNWQWSAGTGCDAAPYFRIFNPESQMEKFDPERKYVKKWIPELGTAKYPKPMVDHREARDRALRAFHRALKGKTS